MPHSRVARLLRHRTPDAEISEAALHHLNRIIKIPSVDHNGITQCIVQPVKIEFAEFLPITQNKQRVCVFRRRVWVIDIATCAELVG